MGVLIKFIAISPVCQLAIMMERLFSVSSEEAHLFISNMSTHSVTRDQAGREISIVNRLVYGVNCYIPNHNLHFNALNV